jgi:serine/threonine protein kinase
MFTFPFVSKTHIFLLGVVHQGTLWGTDVAIKRLNTIGFSFGGGTTGDTIGDTTGDTPTAAMDEKTTRLRDQLLSDLTKEVKILSELRHPNVVLYIGVCTAIPHVCIVTELCPRRSLFDIIHDPSVALSCELR